MSAWWRYRLAGMALLLGGLTAGLCHMFNFDSPGDVLHLAQYTRFSEPVHLSLFLAGVVVLLGWFGQYALQCSSSGMLGFAAFLSLFVGILCGDLLHCILEFSVFPVLGSQVPYALPGLATATYHSTPMAVLLEAGKLLTLVGLAAMAWSIYRSYVLPVWSAIAFAAAAIFWAAGSVPQAAPQVVTSASVAVYISMALLGIAILCSEGPDALDSARTADTVGTSQ